MMSSLRKERGLSQRKAASDLKISQALLSHYENGAREPGLNFVCRACDYYEVSADYLLGRIKDEPKPETKPEDDTTAWGLIESLRNLADETEARLKSERKGKPVT
jgi:transcriptional regulator with XRE-family HTH domain